MRIGPRSHDHIGTGEHSIPTLDNKVGPLARDSRDTNASQDWKLEMHGVLFQIVRQYIFMWEGTLWHRKWQSGQRVVLRGGKQPQGVPAAAPRVAGALVGIYDEKGAAGTIKMIAGRKT